MQESLAFLQKRRAEENATLILNGSKNSVALEAAAKVSSYLTTINVITTRIMVTIKKRAGVIPYSFSSSIALLLSLLSCSFYLLDLRTISSVDILEMT